MFDVVRKMGAVGRGGNGRESWQAGLVLFMYIRANELAFTVKRTRGVGIFVVGLALGDGVGWG